MSLEETSRREVEGECYASSSAAQQGPNCSTVSPHNAYQSSVERFVVYMRKPIVALTALASLLNPLQGYADQRLQPGRDACLAAYVKKQPDLLASFEQTIRLYGEDPSHGVEVLVNAIACRSIGKQTQQFPSYTLLILKTGARDHAVPLNKRMGLRLEECIRRLNAATQESVYCAVCDDLGPDVYPDQYQRQPSEGEDPSGSPAESPHGRDVSQAPEREAQSRDAYARMHAERKGKSGVGAFAAGLGIAGLALLLSGARRAAGVGGVVSGPGAGAVGPGFSRGGTSAIPPLPGTAHR